MVAVGGRSMALETVSSGVVDGNMGVAASSFTTAVVDGVLWVRLDVFLRFSEKASVKVKGDTKAKTD